MKNPKIWRLGGVLVGVLVLVGAWFLMITPQRDTAAALDLETANQQSSAAQLRSKISLLKKQSEELPAQEAKLASIQQKLPPTDAIPSLIRTMTSVASKASVTMSALTPGAPTAVVAAEPDIPTAAPTDTASTATASPTADEPAAPASGVLAIPVTMTVCGSYAELRTFMGDIEAMTRAMLVSGLSIAKGGCGDNPLDTDLTATVTAAAFTLPQTPLPEVKVPGATDATPTPATSGA